MSRTGLAGRLRIGKGYSVPAEGEHRGGGTHCSGYGCLSTIVGGAYLEQVLCPGLRSGQIVILDNLAAHKVDGVQRLVESTGARLLYLPPYSPDFNPIEQAWSKIKQLLRAAKARTIETLETAIADALAAITRDNARAWFAHCGYGLQ